MNSATNADALINPSSASKLTDSEWVALHVPRFNRAKSAYESYEGFIRGSLLQACKRVAPTAIVEVRTKKLPSFAEKILRKRSAYQDPKDPLPPDPLVRLTDLCGGRVVTQTAEEVQSICRFIESAFDIDWPNSEDVSQRLKPTEFGYRSVHYIVQLNPNKLKDVGIKEGVPQELLGFSENVLGEHAAHRPLKAEIQVRTLLEHAAAALGHDTIYKSELKVPNQIKRHHATLSAVLENVDSSFGQMLASLKAYRSSLGAYQERNAVVEEIARLQIVLSYEPNNTDLAVRIARHALAIGEHETAEKVLSPFASHRHFGVQRTLGQVLIEMYWDSPKNSQFRSGRKLLEAACADPPKDSETLCLLAESLGRDDDERSRKLFQEAIQADATEPVTLARYLEFEIAHMNNDNAARLATPMIRTAMDRCRKQIEAQVNLPAAWSSLAFFHLLLDESFKALDALTHVGLLCQGHTGSDGNCSRQNNRPCAAGRALVRFRATLRRVSCIRERFTGFEWCERAVLLILASRIGDRSALKELRALGSTRGRRPLFSKKDKVVILAGACQPQFRSQIDELRPHLLRACEGLSFKLLSGGTKAGISGLAGDIAEKSAGRIAGFGYLPRLLPRGVKEDESKKRFAHRFNSAGNGFTPLDPMQGWTDLVVTDVDATRVKLLCYAGGEISRAECMLALAMGARVGIIENKHLAAERQFTDSPWLENPNAIRLPMDAMTLRAYLLVDELPMSAEQQKRLEKAARKAHEDYVASATPRDPSFKRWEELDEALKLSNYHQVAYWEKLLKDHGLQIRKLADEDIAKEPLVMDEVLGSEGVKELAEMEHGRWNVERLARGWKFDVQKDVARKRSPFLVPWTQLEPKIQQYDLDAIRGMPAKLREVGLELEKTKPLVVAKARW